MTKSKSKTKTSAGHKSNSSEGSLVSDKLEEIKSPIISIKDQTKLLVNEDSVKKWQNWKIRTFWTLVMVCGFLTILSLGALPLVLLVLIIQVRIFSEIINLSIIPSKERKLPFMRAINWYFFFVANNFLCWESLIKYFKGSVETNPILKFLATHHRFKSFLFYCFGLVWFVINLKKGHYRFQFTMFAVTHMLLLLVVFSSHFIIYSIFEGLFWCVLPVSLVIVNDIAAYISGFFFGKTPLIEISPKKTWEGFIGGFLLTTLYGVAAALFFSKFDFFICPVHDPTITFFSFGTCTPNPVFIPSVYTIPSFISGIIGITQLTIKPVIFHSLMMSLFASIIAPFGGFFASGFKRAFNIKDFADVIPGHGGLTDRFDCQLIMGIFSYIYYSSFIKVGKLEPDALFEAIVNNLTIDQQIDIFKKLQHYVQTKSLIA